MRHGVLTVLAAVTLVSAGCSDSTAPPEPPVASLAWNVPTRPAFFPPFDVSRASGVVRVLGTFEGMCQPTDGDAEASMDGTVLILVVSGTAAAECTPVTQNILYDVSITNGRRATAVRIIHRWPGTERADETVFDGPFV